MTASLGLSVMSAMGRSRPVSYRWKADFKRRYSKWVRDGGLDGSNSAPDVFAHQMLVGRCRHASKLGILTAAALHEGDVVLPVSAKQVLKGTGRNGVEFLAAAAPRRS